MDEEKLIELVRKYEFIYNTRHLKYMDGPRKDNAWKEIARELQQSVAHCKEKWHNLRDAFRRYVKKKREKRANGDTHIKPWKYENEMAFLVPYFHQRKRDSLENKSEGEESDNSACRVDDQFQAVDLINTAAPHFVKTELKEGKLEDEEEDSHSVDTTHDSYNYDEWSETERNTPRAKKRKMIDLERKVSSAFMKKLLSYRCKASRELDELDNFFLNVSDTIKKFSPYQQAVAKNKIFNLVSEMELQMLNPATAATSNQKV